MEKLKVGEPPPVNRNDITLSSVRKPTGEDSFIDRGA
jgi:hypothetical protein